MKIVVGEGKIREISVPPEKREKSGIEAGEGKKAKCGRSGGGRERAVRVLAFRVASWGLNATIGA